jgi:hypothetical protein
MAGILRARGAGVECVVGDPVRRVQAAVLERLERWTALSVERHNFPVYNRLLGLHTQA